MELRIVSPHKQQRFDVAWIEIDTTVGNFVLQPGHVPTVFSLLPNSKVTFRLTTGKQEAVTVKRAVLQVTRTKAVILVNE